MHVGIDYWPATTHAPGVGRYARELVRALAGLDGAPALTLLQLGIGRPVIGDLGLGAPCGPIRRRRLPLPRRLLRAPWFPAADELAGGVDLFHHVIPGAARVRRARQTVALSEVPEPGSRSAARLGDVLGPLDAVLVFGNSAAAQAGPALGLDARNLRVVPVGCDHWVRGRHPSPLPAGPPELLVLGAPHRNRRPETILAAYDRLLARGIDCRLHFVGGSTSQNDDFARQVAARSGVTHDLPPETRLPEVVSRAAVLVHLNEGEATAVTPLEAFSFGLAVVGSDLPAFREALDGEATLLETRAVDENPDLLADCLAAALQGAGDEAARTRRRAVAGRFTWKRNAEATLAVWRELLGTAG